MKSAYPNHAIPLENVSLYSKVFNRAQLGLDYYTMGNKEQYAIVLYYEYCFIAYPSIIPTSCNMNIIMSNNNIISLESAIVQKEDHSALKSGMPGDTGIKSVGYFPITEEQLNEICSFDIKELSFDILISKENIVTSDKSTISDKNFSKKMEGYYKKILKQKKKIKNNQNAQNNEQYTARQLLLLYHNYSYDPFLYGQFLKESNQSHNSELWALFNDYKTNVHSYFDNKLMLEIKQEIDMRTHQNQQAAIQYQNNMQNLLASIQQSRAQRAAAEAAEKERVRAQDQALREDRERRVKEQQASDQRRMSNMAAATQNVWNQNNNSNNSTRKMETSDLDQYTAIRMSDAAIGTEATNQALAQQRQYAAQQRQQAGINAQRNFDQNLGVTENAITSSGEHIQIKVNNGAVTAYSTSQNNFSGTGPEWTKVNAAVSASRDTRYGYEADITSIGKKVYWGVHPQTNQNDMGGTALNAVTANGETIQIRINDKVAIVVAAYRRNGNLPWNNIIAYAKATNITYDGETIASRFKYKAEIPEFGTIYF